MPVLKRYNTTPAMREAIVLDLGDIGAQAARIRAAAEVKASKIIAEAQSKSEALADQLHEQAREQGYTDGLEQGLAQGREQGRAEALAQSAEQLRQLTAAWSQVASDWEQQRTDMEREARQAVLEFALSAAEKIVHRVIEVDESVIVDQAAQALSLVLSAHDASVRIHPVDRPMLEDALPQLIRELASLEHVELIDDEAITPGGCVVAFGHGRIDATIEKQLQRLIDLILPEPPQVPDDEPEEAAPVVQAPKAPPKAPGKIDAASRPPVYEITEQGLVQTQGDGMDELMEADADGFDEADDLMVDDDPQSEA